MDYGKLIELLNEFDKPLGWYYEDGVLDCKLNLYEYMAYEWICSARYGFIKRLVENDKIKDYYEGNDDIDYVREKYGFYEALLMLLSIQDEPIKFLISLLKNV